MVHTVRVFDSKSFSTQRTTQITKEWLQQMQVHTALERALTISVGTRTFHQLHQIAYRTPKNDDFKLNILDLHNDSSERNSTHTSSFIPTWRKRSHISLLSTGLRQVGTAGYILANPYSQVDRGTPSFSLVQDLPSYIASSQMQQISELYNETCAVDRWSLVPPKLVCQEAGNEHWERIWISASFDVCGILWVLPCMLY